MSTRRIWHLDIVVDLAGKHEKPIDLHLCDPGELGCHERRRIPERALALRMQGRIAVSHGFALGGVVIMTNGPGAKTMPPIRTLAGHDVLVFVGADNSRGAWSSYGNGDMLDRARLVGYRAGLLGDADMALAFALVTSHAAQAIGAPADLVVVRATHVPEAVATAATRERAVKRAHVIAGDGVLV